jgi:hypothetical protein
MKLIQTISIIGILLLVMGCQIKKVEETLTKGEAILAAVDGIKGYCTLTATADRDGYFLIIDKLFAEGIPCNTNDDCYNFLLEQDDFGSLAPEFHAFLNCEKVEEPIVPNKITYKQAGIKNSVIK